MVVLLNRTFEASHMHEGITVSGRMLLIISNT